MSVTHAFLFSAVVVGPRCKECVLARAACSSPAFTTGSPGVLAVSLPRIRDARSA